MRRRASRDVSCQNSPRAQSVFAARAGYVGDGNSRARLRSRAHARLGADVSLGAVGKGFLGALEQRAVYVEQRGEALHLRGAPAKTVRALFRARSSARGNLRVVAAGSGDADGGGDFCRGLRIMRQPRWECLATFITSSMKQVAHIRQISRTLRERFGLAAFVRRATTFTAIRGRRCSPICTRSDLRHCALGYRAKNLLATAQLVASGEVDLEALAALPDDELRARALRAAGRGREGRELHDAFRLRTAAGIPDRRLGRARAAREIFPAPAESFGLTSSRNSRAKYFGAQGGYAQQYLFHHARKTTPRRLSPRKS